MIYLDNSATTQALETVSHTMANAMRTDYFNPSALYHPAVAAEKSMEACRAALKQRLQAQEVIYTASGTESDNLALMGTARRLYGDWDILLSAAEHPAVLMQKEALQALGHQVLLLPLTPEGLLDLAATEEALSERTALVSCMQVSNETGAIQPLEALSSLLRAKAPQALLHVDGVQGFLRLPMNLRAAHVDLYTLSGHKIHGPKGIGALATGPRAKLSPLLFGGGQERGLRPGTENLPAILGLDAAIRAMDERTDPAGAMRRQKLALYKALSDGIPGLTVNGPPPESPHAAPHILNLSLPGIRGEVMVHALEDKGVLAGTGSACSSKKRKRSEGFASMNVSNERAESAVRLSLSPLTTDSEIDRAIEAFTACYALLKPYQRR